MVLYTIVIYCTFMILLLFFSSCTVVTSYKMSNGVTSVTSYFFVDLFYRYFIINGTLNPFRLLYIIRFIQSIHKVEYSLRRQSMLDIFLMFQKISFARLKILKAFYTICCCCCQRVAHLANGICTTMSDFGFARFFTDKIMKMIQ